MPSFDSWSHLSNRPRVLELKESVKKILEAYQDEIAFIALFDSMARGDFGVGSDFD
jgi:predicted nucleotidyltransferase